MAEEASGRDGAAFVLALDDVVTVLPHANFERMVERRLTGEPLQYVLGRWGFRTLDLLVDRRALIPRPETEFVAEVAFSVLALVAGGAPATVVDLGTGNGALALAIAAERTQTSVIATDASPAALNLARANLAGIGRAATRVTLAHGSWYGALRAELRGAIDLIVSNPPYVGAVEELPPEVAEWEPLDALIAGPTGLEAVHEVVGGAPEWLRPGGGLVVEIGDRQGELAAVAAQRAGLVDVEVRLDLTGRPRVLVARAPSSRDGEAL
jgi:release factor glutamine methyltransferase